MRSMCSSRPPARESATLSVVLSFPLAAPPPAGLKGTPGGSGLHCWTKEWKKWDVDEGQGADR